MLPSCREFLWQPFSITKSQCLILCWGFSSPFPRHRVLPDFNVFVAALLNFFSVLEDIFILETFFFINWLIMLCVLFFIHLLLLSSALCSRLLFSSPSPRLFSSFAQHTTLSLCRCVCINVSVCVWVCTCSSTSEDPRGEGEWHAADTQQESILPTS